MRSQIPPVLIKPVLKLTDFLDGHPWLVQNFLRRISNAPIIRRYLRVAIRGFMGSSAFDCHVVDAENGRVIFGGVKEIFYPSCISKCIQDTLVQKLGVEKADEILRKVAAEAVYQEVKFGAEGNWFPGLFLSFLGDPSGLDMIRSDPDLLHLIGKGVGLMNRFIHDEGGYGHIELDLAEDPIRVTITNSLPVRLANNPDRPMCSSSCGMMEGAMEYMYGQKFHAEEVECAAMGAPRCVFELVRESVT
jgi:hypothetical protein